MVLNNLEHCYLEENENPEVRSILNDGLKDFNKSKLGPYEHDPFTLYIKTKSMESTIVKKPVHLTEGAVNQLKRIYSEQNLGGEHGLRIGVKGGGCSGFSYVLGFDVQKDKDDVYEIDGMKVFMEKAHSIYLLGMEIDWVDGLNNRGFTFKNPNATDTCGCGTSFSA